MKSFLCTNSCKDSIITFGVKERKNRDDMKEISEEVVPCSKLRTIIFVYMVLYNQMVVKRKGPKPDPCEASDALDCFQ